MAELQNHRAHFLELIDELHRQGDLDSPDCAVDATQSAVVTADLAGARFVIEHAPDRTSDRLTCHCRLGGIAPGHADQVLREVLQMNHRFAASDPGGGTRFCLDSHERVLQLSFCLALQGLDAVSLHEHLAVMAELVSPWLDGGVLVDADGESADDLDLAMAGGAA